MGSHRVSVIVSSYNQPNTLRLVLAGLRAQDDLDFELIVGDDGSDADTQALVEEFGREAPFPVQFVTKPHTQFAKPEALNRAALVSHGDQLIFCDGDCLPFRNFVSAHRRHYRPNGFCAGGYIRLDLAQSQGLTMEGIREGEHERFLTSRRKRRLYRKHYRSLFHKLIGRRYEPKVLGGNLSVDRGAFWQVNGFDEDFIGLSKSDSDLRNRLANSGNKGISVWNSAFVLHLDHRMDPRRCQPGAMRRSTDRQFYLARRGRVRAERGLDGHTRDASKYEKPPA